MSTRQISTSMYGVIQSDNENHSFNRLWIVSIRNKPITTGTVNNTVTEDASRMGRVVLV